jgi:hypothetical protein
MCFGGGGNAAGAAQAEEAQRAAGIASNVRNINSAFANRGAQYDTYKNALQGQYQTELNRQQGIASRNNKFALARSGLTGGSAAVDAGKLLSQDEQRGTVNAQQQVQGAVAKLQGADEATRQQEISLAQGGGDIGDAAIQTANSLRANIGNAQSTNAAQSLGNVFGDVSTSYTNMNTAAALRRGIYAGSARASLYGSPAGSLGSLGGGGSGGAATPGSLG